MRTLEMRSLEVRDGADDGTLTLAGLAVPYGQAIEYGGIRESFAEGAFDDRGSVDRPLLWSHDRTEPIGHITAASNSPDGLQVEAVVQPTVRGRDAITLLRSKSLRGLSVGFEPTEWTTDADGSITYTAAQLHELSLTPLPAYTGAGVTATRNEPSPEEGTDMDTAVLDGLNTRIDQIEARMIESTPKPPVRHLSVREAWIDQLSKSGDSGGAFRLRALADVLSSGNAGVLPPSWSSEVRTTVDSYRYLIPRLGSVAFPGTGHALTVPKILQHTLVGPRGTEKTQVPSQALTTGSDTFTASWFAGGVDVALELVSQSDPSIVGLVVDDLMGQYAAVTDQFVTTQLETAATASGAALDFTSYGSFVAGVMAAAEDIRAATGTPGNLLQLTSASWASLIGLVDANGRRILATGNAQNSDGSAGLLSTSVDIGGIEVFHNPRAAADVQTNRGAARVAEKPPLQVQSDNVALMGRDLGILGAVIFLPFYPAGILRHAAIARQAPAAERK